MGWLRLVGSLKLYVSLAKEPYKRDDITHYWMFSIWRRLQMFSIWSQTLRHLRLLWGAKPPVYQGKSHIYPQKYPVYTGKTLDVSHAESVNCHLRSRLLSAKALCIRERVLYIRFCGKRSDSACDTCLTLHLTNQVYISDIPEGAHIKQSSADIWGSFWDIHSTFVNT